MEQLRSHTIMAVKLDGAQWENSMQSGRKLHKHRTSI